MIFVRKMRDFNMIIARKTFFRIFFGREARASLPTPLVSYA